MSTEALKLCPFCGAAPEDEYANGCRYIYCTNEKCAVRPHVNTGPDQMERMGLRRGDYEKWVADQWNTRATPAPAPADDKSQEAIGLAEDLLLHADSSLQAERIKTIIAALRSVMTDAAITAATARDESTRGGFEEGRKR